MIYAELILPLPLSGCFTYSIPSEWSAEVKQGSRVVVSFGQRKYYTGIVRRILLDPPEGFEIKPIEALLDSEPIVTPMQLRLWEWIASYYLCTVGEVMKAALPTGLKPDGNTEEGLRRGYRPRCEAMLRLDSSLLEEENMQAALASLRRAQKQQELLLRFLAEARYDEMPDRLPVLPRRVVNELGSPAALSALIKRGYLEVFEEETGRLDLTEQPIRLPSTLNPAQMQAYGQIKEQFREKDICLLHGVTASGKTELYIHLMEEAVKAGKQVLYLLPEIALTTQITGRLQKVFGNRLGVYHSQYADEIRVEIWQKQLGRNPYPVILGARSAVFLPFKQLGLVIVDEEHENSYKQFDPAPRYHARSAALMLASYAGAKVLLGSATPSVDSYRLAKAGRYGLAELKERYSQVQMPRITAVDVKELRRKRLMQGNFSPLLLAAVRESLGAGEQVILFQNRRGFSPMLECKTCGWVPRCKNCDVSLTFHKRTNRLVCHYCGYTEPVPTQCPACEEQAIQARGLGTERVEDEIAQLFPEACIARMDVDTAHTRSQYEKLLAAFQERKIDILIGTQMISKGLDFEHVRIVGILDADTMLNFPDYRAHERAFQLMAQVSGRAGRRGRQGQVILQTRSMDHPIIAQVIRGDYEGMYQTQMQERELFRYPPFYRLIYIYVKHRNAGTCQAAALQVAALLRHYLRERVAGPIEPVVSRVQQLYIRQCILKIEHSAPVDRVREILHYVQQELLRQAPYKSVVLYYDVDPM